MEGSREEQDALQVGICQSSSRTAASGEMKLGRLRGDACFSLSQPLCTALSTTTTHTDTESFDGNGFLMTHQQPLNGPHSNPNWAN